MNEHLKATLGLNTGPFATGLRGAKGLAAGFAGSVGKMLGPDLVAGISAALAYGGLKKAFSFADTLGTLRDETGATSKTIQAFREAATQTGNSAEMADKALSKLASGMGEAMQGTGEAKMAFDQLGISLVDADGYIKSTDTVLKEVADGLKAIPDAATKAGLAKKLFGQKAASLAVTLGGGSEALAKFGDALERTGRLVSDEEIAQLDKYDKALKRMQDSAFIAGTKGVGILGSGIEKLATFIGGATAKFDLSGGIFSFYKSLDFTEGFLALSDAEEALNEQSMKQVELANEKIKAQKSLIDLKKQEADAQKEIDDNNEKNRKLIEGGKFESLQQLLERARGLKAQGNLPAKLAMEAEQAKLAEKYLAEAERLRGVNPEASSENLKLYEFMKSRIGSLQMGQKQFFGDVPLRDAETAKIREAQEETARAQQLILETLNTGIIVIPKNGP